MSDGARDRRYIEVTSRTTAITVVGANLLTVMTVVAVWGDWLAIALLVGVQIALVPFNVWIDRRLGRWGVARAEVLRNAVNLSGVLVCGVFAGWPFPIWFWMLFVALSFDQFRPRVFWTILLSFMVVQVVAGLLSGGPWIYAACFAAFALFCSQTTAARLGVIRHMLVRADHDRAELEAAHAETRAAHEQLLEQTRVREQMEVELRQAQKLESVGPPGRRRRARDQHAGAVRQRQRHFLRDAIDDLVRADRAPTRERCARSPAGVAGEAAAARRRGRARRRPRLPRSSTCRRRSTRSLEGLDRVATIVRSMKEFAHPDQKEMAPVDLNQAIQQHADHRAQRVQVRGRRRDRPRRPAAGQLPRRRGQPGACSTSSSTPRTRSRTSSRAAASLGRIAVRTRREGDDVVIAIGDTGGGIPPQIRDAHLRSRSSPPRRSAAAPGRAWPSPARWCRSTAAA